MDAMHAHRVSVIIPVRNEKTGAYGFREEIILQDALKDYLAKQDI